MSIFKTVFKGPDNILLLTKILHYWALKVLLTKTKTIWKPTVRSTWNCSIKFLSFLISLPLSPEESSQPLTGLKYSTGDSFVLRCTGGAAWRSLPPKKEPNVLRLSKAVITGVMSTHSLLDVLWKERINQDMALIRESEAQKEQVVQGV